MSKPKFKRGDRVRVIGGDSDYVGWSGFVQEDASYVPIVYLDEVGDWAFAEEKLELIPTETFTVGDKVKVLDSPSLTFKQKGLKGKVGTVECADMDMCKVHFENGVSDWFFNKKLESVHGHKSYSKSIKVEAVKLKVGDEVFLKRPTPDPKHWIDGMDKYDSTWQVISKVWSDGDFEIEGTNVLFPRDSVVWRKIPSKDNVFDCYPGKFIPVDRMPGLRSWRYNNKLKRKKGIMETLRDSLRSKKDKLYDEYVFRHPSGGLDLNSTPVQTVLLKILEDNGLKDEVVAYDKKLEEERKDCGC